MGQAPRTRRRWRISPTGRIRLIGVVSIAVLCFVLWNLIAIQGVDQQQAAQRALDGRLTEVAIPAHRGVIQTADGTVLASNAARFRVVVDQQNVADYADEDGEPLGAWGAAQDLATVLDTDPGLLLARLRRPRPPGPLGDT